MAKTLYWISYIQKLVNNKKGSLKCTSKPSLITQKIFDNDLVAIHKIKTTLIFNNPAYVGMCILELSKVWILLWLYQKKYGNKSRLLFTDNESLIYDTENENIYDDLSKNKETFDFSNYSAKSKYYMIPMH